MKTVFRTLGIIALIAVIAFAFTACPDSSKSGGGGGGGGKGGSPTAPTFTYSGISGIDVFMLTIKGKAGQTEPATGDTFTLSVNPVSTGTVTGNTGGKLTLKPSRNGAPEFSTTVSAKGITAMSDTITFDNGTTKAAPATITAGAGGTLTITGVPAIHANHYFQGLSDIMSADPLFFAAETPTYGELIAIIKGKRPSGGTVTLNVYGGDWIEVQPNAGKPVPFTGSRTASAGELTLNIFSSETFDLTNPSAWDSHVAEYNSKLNVQFTNGSATVRWADLEKWD